MFFDDLAQATQLILQSDFAILALPEGMEPKIKADLEVAPDNKGKIGVEAAREMIDFCTSKQTKEVVIVVKEAEKMSVQAQNALLKLLEEPKAHYHLTLITNNPSALLPTVLSRGRLYVLRKQGSLEAPIECEEKVKNYAKRLISARATEITGVMKEITSDSEYKKTGRARPFTLEITGVAIQILYKSYFATRNPVFLKKLPRFLLLLDNLKQNGNIKLHLVADLC